MLSTEDIIQYMYIWIVHVVPLEPELAMSIFAYDPFGTETTYFCILILCQMGHK